jgi:hypothetical protein
MAIPAYAPSKDTQEAILQFSLQCTGLLDQQWNIREQFRMADLAYMRETDSTLEQARAKAANRRGDPSKFQNVVIPVVMPQVESAVTYQQSVFLTGYPIFGVVSFPEFADAAMQMDTIIGEQQVRGKWIQELLKVMRNGFKYNIAACEVQWQREVSYALEEKVGTKEGNPTEILWAGNKLKALDMYNTFWDTRCVPNEVAEFGEFAGYTELYSRIRLKKFIQGLATKINVTEAFESGMNGNPGTSAASAASYYVPILNPDTMMDLSGTATTDWMAWAGMGKSGSNIQYKNMYQVTTLYGRILPSDFQMRGIPSANTAQIWMFLIVNNKVVIHAERLTNAHSLLPILFYQPLEDGLGYQTKSFSENIKPIQEITTALANSSIAARRRAMSDRMLFDPSRVSAAALNNDNPSAKIPVRPAAYQDDLSKAVYAFPFRDDQFQINSQEISFYSGLANQISGLNPARQGQFVKGNKTRTEFQETMGFANGRDQAIALSTEASFFTPLKEIIKMNILQYQGGVGLFNREAQVAVKVDPVMLRRANMVFKISDGLTPSEKLMDGESLAMAMQTISAVPQLAAAYDIGPMFSYLMKSRGARLQPFEKSQEQLSYEQALQAWQQSAMMIAQAAKEAEPKLTPEQLQEMVKTNPQPLPEQFGYVPGKPSVSQGNDLVGKDNSILTSIGNTVQQINQADAQSQQAQQQASQPPAQGAQ